MVHLFPSRLTAWMHTATEDCGCGTYRDGTLAVVCHTRFPAEAVGF